MSLIRVESLSVISTNKYQTRPNKPSMEIVSNPTKTSLYSLHSLSTPLGFSLSARPLFLVSPLLLRRSVFAFSASNDDSPSDIDVEQEKEDLKEGGEESQEAWKETLASFKEQALKMQSVSQEAYDLYSKKATVILLETSKKLKIQAEKAKQDLTVVANEISEEGREYLTTAAENSPEPVKDIVETFATSTNDVKEISEIRDFYLGIPYGILLSVSGFLSFMLTGGTSGIRFGMILGGTLLALSVSSLRSWKDGKTVPLVLKGQAAIASILFLRQICLVFKRPAFTGCFTALFSGAMVAFYLYRIKLDGDETKASNLKQGA